jgi:aspartyl protease family protein
LAPRMGGASLMESRSVRHWALREVLVWAIAAAGGYVTFTSFEPIYNRARQAASLAGFDQAFDYGQAATGISRFSTRLIASALPLRGTFPAAPAESGSVHKITLNANEYGHFHAQAEIKGQQVEFMTDTGATYVALSYETALRLGLSPQNLRFDGRSTTANGVARVASVTLDSVRIGTITVRNVQAVVAEPGRMTQNLLGMSFIKQLAQFELKGTKLIMKE